MGGKEKQGSLENPQKKLYLFLHYNQFYFLLLLQICKGWGTKMDSFIKVLKTALVFICDILVILVKF